MTGSFWLLATRSRKQTQLGCRRPRRARPCLDLLEDRTLLSFGSPLVMGTGATNAAVAIGNIFGDSFPSGGYIPDLVTASTNGSIIIARGKGNGTFQTPRTYLTGTNPQQWTRGYHRGGPDWQRSLGVPEPGERHVRHAHGLQHRRWVEPAGCRCGRPRQRSNRSSHREFCGQHRQRAAGQR